MSRPPLPLLQPQHAAQRCAPQPQLARAATALARPLRKNTPCARFEQYCEAAFVASDGALHDTPSERRMLSTGEHVHVATARLVAAFLRRLVCPAAVDAPCAELLRIFNISHWTSGAFLKGLLADFAADFYRAPLAAAAAAPAHAYASDADFWQRNWAWCDPRTGVCAGAVPKQAWLNPRTRGPACRAVISEQAQHASSTVHFCFIDGGTERLCQLVLEWNAEITVILYRAAGMAACPSAAFFYNPAGYSADNRQFEHDAAQAFYASTGNGKC